MKTAKQRNASRPAPRVRKARKKPRARGLSPAELDRYSHLLTEEEANQMIRDVEEAFEKVYAE